MPQIWPAQRAPTLALLPSLCAGVQPISLAQSTNIYGTVCATGQTSTGPNNNIQPGNGGQGLVVGCTAPSVSPPSYDRAGQIAAVTTTSGSTSNPYACWGATAVSLGLQICVLTVT